MAAPTCEITGSVCNGDGTIVPGAIVKAAIKSTGTDQGGQFAGAAGVTSFDIEAFTEETGSFVITLIQGGTFLLEIPSINLRKEIVVPLDSTALLSDLV